MEISDKIKNLSQSQARVHDKYVIDCLNDRTWCNINGVDYLNVTGKDVKKAREIAYLELFEPDKIRV